MPAAAPKESAGPCQLLLGQIAEGRHPVYSQSSPHTIGHQPRPPPGSNQRLLIDSNSRRLANRFLMDTVPVASKVRSRLKYPTIHQRSMDSAVRAIRAILHSTDLESGDSANATLLVKGIKHFNLHRPT